MAFLNAQRAKLAAMSAEAEAVAAQTASMHTLGQRVAELDSLAAEALNARHVTELTSSELEQSSIIDRLGQATVSAPAARHILCTACFDVPCACKDKSSRTTISLD